MLHLDGEDMIISKSHEVNQNEDETLRLRRTVARWKSTKWDSFSLMSWLLALPSRMVLHVEKKNTVWRFCYDFESISRTTDSAPLIPWVTGISSKNHDCVKVYKRLLIYWCGRILFSYPFWRLFSGPKHICGAALRSSGWLLLPFAKFSHQLETFQTLRVVIIVWFTAHSAQPADRPNSLIHTSVPDCNSLKA